MLSEGMTDHIIGLYALGTSTRDISNWLEETVGTSISAETISSITDRVLPELEAWRNRSLDEVYPIVCFPFLGQSTIRLFVSNFCFASILLTYFFLLPILHRSHVVQ